MNEGDDDFSQNEWEPSRGGCELFMELELGDSVLHKSKLGSLLGYHETLEVGCIDHSLVNLHFRKSVVDLGGREFNTEGHEGVSEGLGIDLALVFEAFEGGKDNVIIVGATGHLGGEKGDHLGEVHGPIDLIKHGLGLTTANVLAVSGKGGNQVRRGKETILVSIHNAKGLLELLDGGVGEGVEDVGFLRHDGAGGGAGGS